MAVENVEDTAVSVPKHVVEVLNQRFGEDIDSLSNADNVLAEYKSKESALAKAIEDSEKKTSDDLVHVMGSCESMLKEIENLSVKIEGLITNHISHNENISKMETQMKSLKKNVVDVENEQAYLIWVKDVKTLGSEVESFILKKNISCAITSYDKLHDIWLELQSTTCSNLKKLVDENCQYIFMELKATLFRELNLLLTSMKYPFPTGISSPHFNKKEDTEEQFKKSLVLLAKLKMLSNDTENSLKLLTELFTEPLKKRFLFHFYGERHTNNPEKPEWYFTQVLNWIRDHSSFLNDYIQPIISESLTSPYNLKMEFCSVLVKLVEEKVVDTIDIIRNKDVMLAHFIDETVMFENELYTLVPHSSVGCLYILLREDFLNLWLKLEEKFTFESMNMKLRHKEAWVPKYSELMTTDKNMMYYAPRCVEEFVAFLSMMNKRHKNLNSTIAQRKFFDILLSSMHHFLTKMKDTASVEVSDPESQKYCSILNGAYYMFHVLEEWAEDTYFIQLYAPRNISETDEMIDLHINDDDSSEERNLFDDILTSLERFIMSLTESIVDNLKNGLKSKLSTYKSETWQALPSIKDYLIPSLSSGACDMMLYIKEHLHLLEKNLCPDIFERVWKQATSMIDHLIFIEVVYEAHFNEGGASQLQFDLKDNLFVLFGQYTTRAESYFRLLKDACILLNLPTGTAYLLKEVLEDNKSKQDYEDLVKNALSEIDIRTITSIQASRLINSRIDYWPKIS